MTASKRPSDSRSTFTTAERIRYWLTEERRLLIAAVTGITLDDARQPLEPGAWSVHGILAHRMFWEGREIEALAQHLLGKRMELLDFPLKRINGTNAIAVETLQRHDTSRVLGELAETRAMLMSLVAKLPDEDLNAIDGPARTLLGVAMEHDREHRRQIEAWRKIRVGNAHDIASLTQTPGKRIDPSQ